FVLRNQAAAPAIMLPVIGTNQARPLGELFPHALTVAVYDSYGNAVENAPVVFEAPTTGATTDMTNPSTITNEDGHASVVATAGRIAGTYTVNARVKGAPSIPFVLKNTTIEPFPDLATNNERAASTGTLTSAP
ncbi:MAG: Ig-like domain-containing protein, partial [Myxococcota bacterium]|nr:Ig-like domain-containing protein [Myxococcota bacterium]